MENKSLNELRRIAKNVFTKAVAAVDPTQSLKSMLRIEKNYFRIIKPIHFFKTWGTYSSLVPPVQMSWMFESSL